MTQAAVKRGRKFNLGLSAFRRRRGSRVSSITSLVVESDSLRIVEAVPKDSGARVLRLFSGRLELPEASGKPDAETLGHAIRNTLKELRINPGTVVMGIPRAQVILRNLQLPAMSDLNELTQMVYFQIGRDLPFSMDEGIIDFKVLQEIEVPSRPSEPADSSDEDSEGEGPPTRMLEILVATARLESVEFCCQTAKAAGLKLAGLGWLPYATARCAELCGLTESAGNIALVSLRPGDVGIEVVGHASLLFSRGVIIDLKREALDSDENRDTGPATEIGCPEEYAGAVTIEVVRSLHGFSGMEHGEPIKRIVVAGVTGCEQKVADELRDRLATETTLFNPNGNLGIPDSARKDAAGAMSAIGLALGAASNEGLRFDFLNPKKPRPKRDLGKLKLFGSVIGVAALILILFAVRASFVNKRLAVYESLRTEVLKIEKHEKLFKQMKIQAATIRNWENSKRKWLDQYAHVSAELLSAEEVYLTSFAVSRNGSMRFGVQAKSGEIIARLDRQLRQAGYDVKPIAINPAADRYGYNFRSSVEIQPTSKIQISLRTNLPPARPADDGSLDTARGGGG